MQTLTKQGAETTVVSIDLCWTAFEDGEWKLDLSFREDCSHPRTCGRGRNGQLTEHPTKGGRGAKRPLMPLVVRAWVAHGPLKSVGEIFAE